ncbi:MAG: sterol desaturase family protein [Alphaproteobacteria bacterium]|nr:sterol desaturase family protein [Alphaproteobacteria bacterium]MCW5743721.1 sterol desaturase family protein [Alphaproteobacteria bacterium]
MSLVSSALEFFLQAWPAMFLIDLLRYVIAASVMALIIVVVARLGFGPGPIQARLPSRGDYGREIGLSLRTVLIFSLNGFGLFAAVQAGIITIPRTLEAAGGWAAIVATFAGILLAHDAWFYWTHRLLHGPAMWRRMHRAHHRSIAPTPFAAYAFDIGEAVIQAIFLPLFLLAVPTHPGVISLFLLIMIVRNVMGHAGVEFHPAIFAPGRALGWLTTTTHHDLHHQTGRWNFGFYFTFWDRLMGTEHPDYAQRFLEARRRRLQALGA